MDYETVLQALKDDKFVSVDGIWSFYGRSMGCGQGCCSDYLDTIEEAAEMVIWYADSINSNIKISD